MAADTPLTPDIADADCVSYESFCGVIVDDDKGKNIYKMLVDKDFSTLEFVDCRILNEGLNHIVNLLVENSHIIDLRLRCKTYSDIDAYRTLCVDELFQKKTHLTRVILDIYIPIPSISRLFKNIADNSDIALENLCIMFHDIEYDGAISNAEYVRKMNECADGIGLFFNNNKTVSELYIIMQYSCTILMEAFWRGFCRNKSIKSFILDVDYQRLSSYSVGVIAEILMVNKTLQRLILNISVGVSECTINEMFIEAMRENTTLCELKINGTDDSYKEIELSDELMAMVAANAPMTKSARKLG